MKDIFVGDIHGEYGKFHYDLRRYKIDNSNIFMCGDFGIGFHKPNYYKQELGGIDKYCKDHNCTIYIIRGNHDDPEYFCESSPARDFFENIIFIEDYNVVFTDENTVLCIGGAHSVDRQWRKSFRGSNNRWDRSEDWWSGEEVEVMSEDFIKKLVDIYNITVVATHTAPFSFIKYSGTTSLDHLYKGDQQLYYDLRDEQDYMESVKKLIMEKHNNVKWIHGHFHHSVQEKHYSENDNYVYQIGLDIGEFYEIRNE